MSKRLLLVEDHDGLRRIMGHFLSEKFDVTGAKNGLEAMGWLSKGLMPDIIVTDTSMPELNGADLITNLRCSGLWADIPIVVLGGTDEENEVLRYKKLGAYEYFKKPFSPIRLQDRLLDIIG